MGAACEKSVFLGLLEAEEAIFSEAVRYRDYGINGGLRYKNWFPLPLYIDENDVKASHALTIGQPDADQLYYLQSRGLSTRQAVGLLSIGYFKPVISLIEDESAREAIESRMEERVGLYEY